MEIIRCKPDDPIPIIKQPLAYLVRLYDATTHRHYWKVGTAEKGTSRFKKPDYKKYSSIKPLLFILCENKEDIYNVEDIAKVYLRNLKGTTWVKNDRFLYFHAPTHIEIGTNRENTKLIEIGA